MITTRSIKGQREEFVKNVNILLCLLCLVVCSTFYYGLRALLLTLTSVIASVLAAWASQKLRGKIINLSDLSPIVSGVLFACLLPASSSYWMVIFGALFSQLVILFPFGGKENCRVNEIAAAFCFCAISWSSRIFRYPLPFSKTALFGDVDLNLLSTSPAASLHLGGKPVYSLWEMMLGSVAGAIGTTSIIIIIASFFFLLSRKNGSWHMSVSTALSFFIFALIFNRTNTNFFISALYELFSGAVLFAAVFLVPQNERYLQTKTGEILFGTSVGIITFLFRYFGGFEESVCFAVLLCSLISPVFDIFAPFVDGVLAKIFKKGGVKIEKAN
jgi:electron transport complex protein RnfD